MSYRGWSGEDAADVADKIVALINSNSDVNGAVVASSGSGPTVLLTAVQAGSPFVVLESDDNLSAVTTIENGSVRYTSNPNFNGNDSY